MRQALMLAILWWSGGGLAALTLLIVVNKAVREIRAAFDRRRRVIIAPLVERYVADTEGEIAAVIEIVEGKPIPAARVEKMLEVVHALSVKPRKGRRKDLARIEKIAASLRKELEG